MNVFKLFAWRGSARSVAMSSYKRGLARTKKHDSVGAMADFTAAVETPGGPEDVKAMALYNRALLFAAADAIPKAIDDLRAVLATEAPLPAIKLAAKRRLERMQHRQIVDDASPHHPNASSRT